MKLILILLAFLVFSCQESPYNPQIDEAFVNKKQMPSGNRRLVEQMQQNEVVGLNVDEPSMKKPLPKPPIEPQEKTLLTVQEIRNFAKKEAKSLNFNEEIPSKAQDIEISPVIQKPVKEIDNSTIDIEIPAKKPLKTETVEEKPSVKSKFEIQAGTFKSLDGAQKLVKKFKVMPNAEVRIDTKNGLNIVRISSKKSINTPEEAGEFLQKFIEKTQHYDAMIVKI